MVEEIKKTDSNTKTQLSLAAALFFSPLVNNMLKKNTRNLSEEENNFVHGYIKLGNIMILFGLVAIISGVMNYLFVLKALDVIYTVSIFILVFLLLISVVSILSDISLWKWRDYKIQTYTIEGNKKDIILKYLPFYNIYLRYKAHSFEKPNRWVKESLILWTIFSLASILGSVNISIILLILIILRIACIMSDVDFVSIKIKQRLNILFLKNPEELRWYVTGLVVYLAKSLVHIFAKMQPYTLQTEITKEKTIYSGIMDIQGNTSLIAEYILWILLTIGLAYIIKIDFTVRTYYVGCWLLVGRYLVMALQWKHLPHLPIAREIVLLVQSVLKKKPFILKK